MNKASWSSIETGGERAGQVSTESSRGVGGQPQLFCSSQPGDITSSWAKVANSLITC